MVPATSPAHPRQSSCIISIIAPPPKVAPHSRPHPPPRELARAYRAELHARTMAKAAAAEEMAAAAEAMAAAAADGYLRLTCSESHKSHSNLHPHPHPQPHHHPHHHPPMGFYESHNAAGAAVLGAGGGHGRGKPNPWLTYARVTAVPVEAAAHVIADEGMGAATGFSRPSSAHTQWYVTFASQTLDEVAASLQVPPADLVRWNRPLFPSICEGSIFSPNTRLRILKEPAATEPLTGVIATEGRGQAPLASESEGYGAGEGEGEGAGEVGLGGAAGESESAGEGEGEASDSEGGPLGALSRRGRVAAPLRSRPGTPELAIPVPLEEAADNADGNALTIVGSGDWIVTVSYDGEPSTSRGYCR